MTLKHLIPVTKNLMVLDLSSSRTVGIPELISIIVNPESGEIQEWALEIINEIKSYTEYSVSGSGVHMIVKGKLPGNRNRTGNIEMYDAKRFFVVTGNRIGDFSEVMERHAELSALYDRIFPNEKRAILF